MSDFSKKKCLPCTSDATPLKGETLKPYSMQLGDKWEVIEEHHLEKKFPFKNFREALAFTNIVGKIAEEEGHHPNIFLSWGEVILQIWTHKIDGLSESDFILASKIEAEYISHQT
ncbi:MAG: 4a-hydroxytetrahydrobiopterin dehydratase [Chlamydiia bacterium]|nr:4a-hydroxytetrahydrobiopterin dehydratase [Chlamydiia bacterium]